MSKTIGLNEGGGEAATNLLGGSGSGVAGTISLGSVIIRPVGISPSLFTSPLEIWFRGNQ
jgi:hypothetical protein